MNYKEKIRHEINEKDESIAEVARQAGISKHLLYAVIHGNRSLTLKTASKIEKVLNLSAKELLEDQMNEKLKEIN
jgi:plasmid maintenance system antidote protein VapI